MGNFLKNTHNYPGFIINSVKSFSFLLYKVSKTILKQAYDEYNFQTFELIKRLPNNANCIDIGAHKADILKKIIRQSPNGKHFAFEPIPWLYKDLQKKYGSKVTIFQKALSDKSGEAEFFLFRDRPAVSGLKKRNFTEEYKVEKIKVETEQLDHAIPKDIPIHLIKIDVEGAEMQVLRGAEDILKKHTPLVIFEFGMGGSDIYNTTPEEMFDFFNNMRFSLSLLEYYLTDKKPFSKEEFIGQYEKSYNYFFIAYYDKSKTTYTK